MKETGRVSEVYAGVRCRNGVKGELKFVYCQGQSQLSTMKHFASLQPNTKYYTAKQKETLEYSREQNGTMTMEAPT